VAYRLADAGATVHLLHVDEPPELGNPLYPEEAPKGAPTPEQLLQVAAGRRRELHALVPTDAAARGIKTDIALVEGLDVALSVEEEAKTRGAEVVVLSSHGRWGLARLAHGESVATRLLHRRDVDVIVVHTDRP
jgi:nucleotide-binding universal stress UspA family protein